MKQNEGSEKYRQIFEFSPEAIVILDKHGNILDVNERLYDWLGYKPEEVIGKNLMELPYLPEESKIKVKEKFSKRMAGDKVPPYMLDFIAKDGRRKVGKIVAALVRDQNCNIVKDIVMITDITEQKDTENRLKESEDRYIDLSENADELIQSVSPDGAFLYVNRAWRETLGYSEKEVTELNLFDIIHPDSRAHCGKIFQRVISGEIVTGIEAVFVSKDGREIFVEGNAKCKFINGKPISTYGIFRNITERKRNEDRLKRINDCLLKLGPDFNANINQLTALCGELLGATCALYNRLEGGLLCSLGQWHTPPNYNPKDSPDGHICHDVIRQGSDEVLVVRNLPQTLYAATDPNVTRYGLKTYFGHAVYCAGERVGSVCVVFQKDVEPADNDKNILSIIASSLSREEERKKAEDALRASEQKFKAIFDSSRDGIVLVDMKSQKFYISNISFCQMLGYSQEEIKNLGVMDIYSEKDLPYIIEQFERIAKEEIDLVKDIPVARKDGTVFYVDIKAFPVILNEKKYLSASFRDITSRQQSEEALRESEEKYRALIETTNTGFVIIDKKGKVLDANPEYVRLAGRSELNEIRGRNVIEWTAEYEKEKNAASIAKCYKDGQIKNLEIDYMDSQSRITPVEINATVAKMGEEAQILTLCRDITERKETERRLLDAEKMATVGKLVAGAAHELNNPLAAIMGFSDLVLHRLERNKKLDINKLKKQIIMITNAAERCNKIITNLLSYGRQIALNLTSLDINKLIDESLTLVKQEIDLKDIKIVKQYSKDSLKIMASKDQLPHVFINIIRNAWRFAQKDKLLKITTEKEGDYVKIVFKDNGKGIKKEHLSKVFDPFFTTHEVGKGTGLGLSVSLGIIKSHKGEITVDSEGEGKGATFTVRLPISVLTEVNNAERKKNKI